MEVVTLSDLAPILAAVVGPMLAVMFAMMRYQHVDSVKTRNLMHELIDKSNRENRDLIDKSNRETRELIRENRDLIEKNHSELSGSLGEVRERLSYIEGYLRQSPPPADDEDAQAAQEPSPLAPLGQVTTNAAPR
ncbi:MAG: hypothetical protein KTV68_04095 [Acidimicrobiia bacterium]|nr:hypothetical protein [Acidimicrobiia bacterium]